ncbi:hypothetical protein GF354_05330 [Candidatus Peregrinibacteria bacterium]|nr:hypothetical protein [Candidatus Peregrinibacteria bacterium]
MSLESFIGFESGEGMSESAFEAFKEKMKTAAAQIAAIKKEEKKQKKKEEDLLKLLLKFIQTSQNKTLTLLIARALEQNIPSNFILAVILLGNIEIQQEIGSFLLPHELKVEENNSNTTALTFFGEDQTLPLKQRIELDNWLKGIVFQADENPHKLIKHAYFYPKGSKDKKIKKALIELVQYVVEDYIGPQNKKYEGFAKFVLKGILKKTEEKLKERNLID